MAKDPAIMFYAQDFITGTMFMSNEQVGIYIRLLCAQHQHGGLIEKTSFNSICGNNDLVRSKFIETDDGFFNKRLADEMMKRSIKSTNMSNVAKIRWNNHANAMQKHTKSNALAMRTEDEDEIVNAVKKTTNKTKFDFEALWSCYPNKLGKKEAERHFRATVFTEDDYMSIQTALSNYVEKAKTLDTQFIKHGSTWFNNWKDWVDYKEPKRETQKVNEKGVPIEWLTKK